MVDQPEVNVLLARIAELEGVVVQQKIQIGEQEATAIDGHGQETFDNKIWANRSTALMKEHDVSAWAEAAMISQAKTIADSNRAALKQSITIGRLVKQQAVPTQRLREMVEDRDQTIKKQEETISDLQARQRREAFKLAGTASKDSKTVKQLEKELQTEKDERGTDAQNAQDEMARAKADAAQALAAHQKQCELERAAANDEHQRDIDKSAASQSQSETKVQALEEQVSALMQEIVTKGEKIKRLTFKLETTTNKLHGATSLMQKAEKGLEAQKQTYESEKQEFQTKNDTSTKRLTDAEAQVKSLQKQVEELVEMDEIHEATKSEYQDEIDEKDGAIKALRAKIEDSEAKSKSQVDIITGKDKEITALKAKIERLKAMWKQLQDQYSSSTTSAYHAKQDVQKKEEMIRKLEAKRLILVAIIDTERKGRDQCVARITTQQAEQSEVVQSLQRDVSSRDERVKDLEKKVEDLRRLLVNTYQLLLRLPAEANHVLKQAAKAVVTLPTASSAPTLPLSVYATTTPIVPLSAGALTGNEATASAIPLPASSATSQAYAPSFPPPSDLSATDPHAPPRSGLEDSWSDIGLPSEHSFNEDSESETEPAPIPVEEPSESEVISSYEVEEPEEPTSSLPLEDGLEVQDITEHFDLLTTEVGEGQRLITWPYGLPQLSILWVQETEIEALSSRTGSLTSNTDKDEPSADSPSASRDTPSEQETKGHEQTPSGAGHDQTEHGGKKGGDLAQTESSSAVSTAAAPPNIVEAGTVDTSASSQASDSTQALPAEQLTPTITVTPPQEPDPLSSPSNQPVPIRIKLSSESEPSTASNTSAGTKGKAKEVITPPSADEASRPAPPQQPSAADGPLPNLVQDSSSVKTVQTVNDKDNQVKGEEVGSHSRLLTVLQLTTQQPRGTSDNESRNEISKDNAGITGIPSDNVEGTLPDADPSTQAYDRPQTEGNQQVQQAVARVLSINVVPIMAGGTHPSMVHTNSSKGKQREEVAEVGDEPMGDEVSPPLTPSPPRFQKLIMIQPRDDGDFEMDDAALTAVPDNSGQDMIELAAQSLDVDHGQNMTMPELRLPLENMAANDMADEMEQDDAPAAPAADTNRLQTQLPFQLPSKMTFFGQQTPPRAETNDAFLEVDCLMEGLSQDHGPAPQPASATNNNAQPFGPPSCNFSLNEPNPGMQPTTPDFRRGSGPSPADSPQRFVPGIGHFNFAPRNVAAELAALLGPVHMSNEFDRMIDDEATQDQAKPGQSSLLQNQDQLSSGFGSSSTTQPPRFVFGNGGADVPISNGFVFVHGMSSMQQQSSFPDFPASGQQNQQQQPSFPEFRQQNHQVIRGAGGLFNSGLGEQQTTYPDPTGLGLAPVTNSPRAPDSQVPNPFANTEKRHGEGVTYYSINADGSSHKDEDTVDDALMSALKKKPLPKGALARKKPVPRRVAQLASPVQPARSEPKRTINEIFAPWLNSGNGESSGGGEANENTLASLGDEELNMLLSSLNHDQASSNVGNGSGNGNTNSHNTFDGGNFIDPRLLILDQQQQMAQFSPPSQQPPTNPEPDVSISPASPTESEPLSAIYESDEGEPREAASDEDVAVEENVAVEEDAAVEKDTAVEEDVVPEDEDDQINLHTGQPWMPDDLSQTVGGARYEEYEEYETNPFTGNKFPKSRKRSSSSSPEPNNTKRSRGDYTQGLQAFPKEQREDQEHENEMETDEKADKGKGKEEEKDERIDEGKGKEKAAIQPSIGVAPEHRNLNPIRRRRPPPQAADFFDSPPEKPFVVTANGSSDENSPTKKHRSSSNSPPSSSPAQHDNPIPNRIHDSLDDPSDAPIFDDPTLFLPAPSSDQAFASHLNDTVHAQRQVTAAKPKADSSISSDEDADSDENSWAEIIPVEPEPGSRGNGCGRKRRGSEAAEVAYRVGDRGDGARVNPAPLYNPASMQGLSQEDMRGTASTIGTAPPPVTPQHQQNPSSPDPRAGSTSARQWDIVNRSSQRENAAGDSGLPRMRDLRRLPTRNSPIGSPTSYQARPNAQQPLSTQQPLRNSTSPFTRASWEPRSDEDRREVYPRDGRRGTE